MCECLYENRDNKAYQLELANNQCLIVHASIIIVSLIFFLSAILVQLQRILFIVHVSRPTQHATKLNMHVQCLCGLLNY